MTLIAGKLENSKELHRRLILDQIRQRIGIARSDLVRLTGLSKATVSTIVAELIDAGLVEESGSHSPSIGRPRVSLSLVADTNYVLGAELTNRGCRVVLTDLHAEPVRQSYCPHESGDLSVAALLALLDRAIAKAIDDIDHTRILALGVCVPGIVDPAAGKVRLSVLLPWHNVLLADQLRQQYPFAVAVFSRGNAATWGEHWYGAGRTVDNLLYVRLGAGVVAGLVLNGQPYLGHTFGAGEMGHITVQPEGELCRCGNRGCLATVVTTDALLNRVRQLLRLDPENPLWSTWGTHFDHLTLADLVAAAEAGSATARQVFAEAGHWVGIALASVINLLNLEMIVVGGPLALAGEHLLQPLRQEILRRALPTHVAATKIVASPLREDASAVGAASLVLHELFSPIPRLSTPVFSLDKVSLFA